MVIGSAPNVDINVPDPLVSRIHAELELRDDGVWIIDVSRNGTLVGDVRVGSARVPNRARIRVGMTDLFLSYDAGETQQIPMWSGSSAAWSA
jgi:pSer/pThr/pTyr-binding forkhead associated (FHA) protein